MQPVVSSPSKAYAKNVLLNLVFRHNRYSHLKRLSALNEKIFGCDALYTYICIPQLLVSAKHRVGT